MWRLTLISDAKRPAKKSKKDDSEDEDEDDQDMGSDDEMTFDIRVKVKKSVIAWKFGTKKQKFTMTIAGTY